MNYIRLDRLSSLQSYSLCVAEQCKFSCASVTVTDTLLQCSIASSLVTKTGLYLYVHGSSKLALNHFPEELEERISK